MAQPTYYCLQCPSVRGLIDRYSQVGAGKAMISCSILGENTSGLLAWRRRCHWESQRSGLVKAMAMGRNPKEAGKGGANEIAELKLEATDLMELEFGKLLEEPRQASLAKVSVRTPLVKAVRTSPTVQGKKVVPLVTFGPEGFAAQSNKPQPVEDDYMNFVQKPAIPSPDSFKPSWPKNDSVPPMLLGTSKKTKEDNYMNLVQKPAIQVAAESSRVLDSDLGSRISEVLKAPSLTGKPAQPKFRKKLSSSPGPIQGSFPSYISEERFARLLELAGSATQDEDVSLETSSTSAAAFVDIPSTRKETSRLDSKPVTAAKPLLQVDDSREVA